MFFAKPAKASLTAVSLIASLLMTSNLSAAEGEEEKDPLKGEVSLSGEKTRGNSKTESIYGSVKASYDTEKWLYQGELKGKNSKSDDVRTDEEYSAYAQADYKLSDANYLFIKGNYEVDKFDGFKYQGSAAIGYGRKLYSTEKHLLKGEIGPGYRRVHAEGKTNADEDATVNGALSYEWTISENTSFTQKITGEWYEDENNESVTVTTSETAYSTRLAAALFLKLSHEIKRVSEVPVGTKETDSQTLVSLSYKF